MLNAILHCCIRPFYLGGMAEETQMVEVPEQTILPQQLPEQGVQQESTPTIPDDPVAGTGTGASMKEEEPKEEEEEFWSELTDTLKDFITKKNTVWTR